MFYVYLWHSTKDNGFYIGYDGLEETVVGA